MKDYFVKQFLKIIEGLITDEILEKAAAMFVAYLRELAAETETELDDAVVDIVAKALGVTEVKA